MLRHIWRMFEIPEGEPNPATTQMTLIVFIGFSLQLSIGAIFILALLDKTIPTLFNTVVGAILGVLTTLMYSRHNGNGGGNPNRNSAIILPPGSQATLNPPKT